MTFINKTEDAIKSMYNQLVALFATHPTVDAFHVTADGQFFINKPNADAQAARLPVNSVATITRAQVEAGTVAAATGTAAGDSTLAHPEQSTALTPEQLQAKAAADVAASAALAAQLNIPTPAAPAATEEAAPAATEEAVPAATEEAPATGKKSKVVKHIVTADDIALNPNGTLVVGEEIDIPLDEIIQDDIQNSNTQS